MGLQGARLGQPSGKGRKAPLTAALLLLTTLILAPTAHAAVRAKTGEIAPPPEGSGKEQQKHPNGVAVNRTGAGGVAAGDVYVVDGGEPGIPTENNRVVQYSATGTFVRMWGIDVVASGPDDKGSGAFEVCLPADVCKAGSESEAAGG